MTKQVSADNFMVKSTPVHTIAHKKNDAAFQGENNDALDPAEQQKKKEALEADWKTKYTKYDDLIHEADGIHERFILPFEPTPEEKKKVREAIEKK